MLNHLVLSLVLCVAGTSVALADDWPMWRHDAARSARSSEELPDTLEILWKLLGIP